jgi:hypothetical protein
MVMRDSVDPFVSRRWVGCDWGFTGWVGAFMQGFSQCLDCDLLLRLECTKSFLMWHATFRFLHLKFCEACTSIFRGFPRINVSITWLVPLDGFIWCSLPGCLTFACHICSIGSRFFVSSPLSTVVKQAGDNKKKWFPMKPVLGLYNVLLVPG